MKKALLLPPLLFALSTILHSQTYMHLQNDFAPANGDNIKFAAGMYDFSDSEKDGIVQIIGKQNITLDGDSVEVSGGGFEGYLFYIENSTNITIKNFDLAEKYFYVLYAINSINIAIEDCNFSHNQRNDEGWITIFDEPDLAHDSGVFMNDCTGGSITI